MDIRLRILIYNNKTLDDFISKRRTNRKCAEIL